MIRFNYILLLLGCLAVQSTLAQPRLFYITTAETKPGDAVLVRGEFLDKIMQVRVCRIDDKASAASRLLYVSYPQPDKLPDSVDRSSLLKEKLYPVQLLQQNKQSLKFIIPGSFEEGVYGVEVTDDHKHSTVFCLNTPIVNWAISEEGLKAVAGDHLRLQGKNLLRKGRNAQVVLVNEQGKKLTGAVVQKAFDDYSVQIMVPATIPVGTYQLYYHNGFGGDMGWSAPLKIDVRMASHEKRDTFNVKDFGAKGDGIQNETSAFRAALAAAGNKGGGIVYVPRGRYVLTGELILSPYTELKGESKALTQLVWSAVNWRLGELPASLISGTHHFSITDLNIWATRAWGIIIQTGPVKEMGHVTLENLIVRQSAQLGGQMYAVKANRDSVDAELNSKWKYSGIILRGENIKVRNCDFNASGMYTFSGVSGFIQHSKFTRNTTGINQPYMTVHPKGLIFEDCYRQADGFGYAATIDESHDLYEARNFTPFDYTNDREVMTLDGGSGAFWGKIKAVESTTITLPPDANTYQWAANKWIGGGVFILSGKGAGQYRRIVHHTLDKITIDQPFLVDPDTASILSITTIRKNLFYVDNEIADGGAYQLYGSAQNVVLSGLKMVRCSGIVSRGSYLYHGKQPNWYVEILNCELREGNYCHWFGTEDRHSGYQSINLIGTGGSGMNVGALVRRNQLFDYTFIRTSPGAEPDAVTDVIIEDNSFHIAKEAIVLGGSGRNTSNVLIHRNHYNNIEKNISTHPGLIKAAYLVPDEK